jgi:hypothetical protein
MSGFSSADGSKAIEANKAVSSRSDSFLSVLSKMVRRIERPIPKPKPRIKPSNKFRAVFGEEGDFGSDALLTMETLMAEELVDPEISRLFAVTANC